MKKISLLIILAFVTVSSKAQIHETDYEIKITEFYKNLETKLVSDTIINVDSLSKTEIKNKLKNVFSRDFFVSSKSVLDNESDNQLTYVYITHNLDTWISPTPMYIRLIAQIKDRKYKLSFYDDGNVYEARTSNTVEMPARSFYVSGYFKNSGNVRHGFGILKPVNIYRNEIYKTELLIIQLMKMELKDSW